MKVHNGMRPQDIAVLLKVGLLGDQTRWYFRDLTYYLHISPSEITESLNRSKIAGLLEFDKKSLNREAFLGFLEHGFRFVFPPLTGNTVKGIPTGCSASPLKKLDLGGSRKYVWPSGKGTARGNSVKPLYKGLVKTVLEDSVMHELLALTDSLRLGKARERERALEEIRLRIS